MNSNISTPDDFQASAARVADAVSDASDSASRQARKFVQNAADTVKDASDYVRDNSGDIGGQIKDYLKANPSHALIGAVAVGFLLGRFMSRE